MVGNGGLLSTMSDLLKWNDNLDNPKVGGRAFVDAMETRMKLTTGRTITYALGLEVSNYKGVREVAHGGSTAGYRTYLARYPEQRASVAVWCNFAGANASQLAHQVADLVLTFPPVVAAQGSAPRADVPASEIAQWAGMYRDPNTDQVVSLAASPTGLTSSGGRGAVQWTPLGGSRFKTPQGEATFTGRAGRRTAAIVRADGDTARLEEVRPAPSAIRVADYVGTYASDEIDVRLSIVARDGKLYLRRRPADEFELRPTYADDFQAVGGGLGTLRFTRTANGSVSGFAIFAGRVLDVRFSRVRQ
jgi:hypothetical protein